MPSIVKRIVVWQVMVGVAAALIWSLAGAESGLAAFAGGLVSGLQSLGFALRALSCDPNAPPAQVARAFYRAEALKLVVAAAVFIIVARSFEHVFLPVVTTYMATLVVYWVALFWTFDLRAAEKERLRDHG